MPEQVKVTTAFTGCEEKTVDSENGMPSTPRATHCYASGWRPEAALKQVATDMIAIIFDASASVDDCRMAAGTLVEAVYPEIMPAPFDLRAANASFRERCKKRGQFP